MSSNRQWEIDALRGLMLVLMVITHVPSFLTDPVGQPFGFVSAAEGFVLLSAYVCGLVYGRIGLAQGPDAMRRALWRRAWKIYLSQAVLLLFLFTVITALSWRFQQPAAHELLKYFLAHPLEGLVYGALLVYQPALLDILPMYVLFMLASPWAMRFAVRHGWAPVLCVSATGWFLAQFGVTEWLYTHAVRIVGIPVPYNETGSFDTLAWQFLWFLGLWLGARRSAPAAQPLVFPRWLVIVASVTALVVLCWRQLGPDGQAAFGDDMALNLLFDKWRLGPLRLADLTALCIVAVRFGPWLAARMPRPRWLEVLGASSLTVFCGHLVAVLLVMSIFGGDHTVRPWWADVAMLVAVFVGLYWLARAAHAWDRRQKQDAAMAAEPVISQRQSVPAARGSK